MTSSTVSEVPKQLSERDSKSLVAAFGVPVPREIVAADPAEAGDAAARLGGAVVVKLNGEGLAHKTERGLVRVGLRDAASVSAAASEILGRVTPDDGPVDLTVAEMVSGGRELILAARRDERFGACVMLGLGGVQAEALGDVVFRLVPLRPGDAEEMIRGIRAQELLDAWRGEAAVDRAAIVDILGALADLLEARPDVSAVELNPVIVSADGRPVAVDALVEVFA